MRPEGGSALPIFTTPGETASFLAVWELHNCGILMSSFACALMNYSMKAILGQQTTAINNNNNASLR
jgi:hypothetical protein